MAEATLDFPELALLDTLIAGLEGLITESDETPLSIEPGQRPRRAMYRILTVTNPSERKSTSCEAIYLAGNRLVLRCPTTEVVRLTPLEVMVLAEKSGRGETMVVIQGKASEIKRIRGGYDIAVEVAEMRKTRVTPGQKLRECVVKNDSAGWNRWCADIRDGIDLAGMDLRGADLGGYDLCCADFTGANLSGANLSGAILSGADLAECAMDGAVMTGVDLFRAKMSRAHAALAQQSGMLELESIIFSENP